MTLQESIEILRKHNEWRRKEEGPETLDPVKLGRAIDMAIEVLSGISIPSDLDKAAEKYACTEYPPNYEMPDDNWKQRAVYVKGFKAGAELMAGQFEKLDGEVIDWYSTSEGKDYCYGIKTHDSFEVPEGFYIKKK